MRRLLCALTLAACTAAAAHGDWPPQHGGQMNEGGETSFELVAQGRRLHFYLEDHGVEIPTQGASGSLTITRGERQLVARLEPAGRNRLRATAPGPLRPGDRLLARVVLANGSVVAGRFVRAR